MANLFYNFSTPELVFFLQFLLRSMDESPWALFIDACINRHLGSQNYINKINNWLVVSTHLKNISQNGNLPQVGMKIKNIWNHHLDNHESHPWPGDKNEDPQTNDFPLSLKENEKSLERPFREFLPTCEYLISMWQRSGLDTTKVGHICLRSALGSQWGWCWWDITSWEFRLISYHFRQSGHLHVSIIPPIWHRNPSQSLTDSWFTMPIPNLLPKS